MATHFSVLAWRIPGTGEPGGCRLCGGTESDTTEVTQQSKLWIFQWSCMCVCMLLLLLLSHISHVRLCATTQTAPNRLLCSWDSPGKNTGVGCHFLLRVYGQRHQKIFLKFKKCFSIFYFNFLLIYIFLIMNPFFSVLFSFIKLNMFLYKILNEFFE